MTNSKAIFLGAAMAGLLLGSTQGHAADKAASSKAAVGECHGVNSCKGKGECAGQSNSCKGQNACKGQGWTKLSKKACDKKKGTFKEMAKM